MRIIRDPKACYGCRACELVCAFHHRGDFSPGGGAIRVWKNNRTDRITWLRGTNCDLCEGRSQPLCAKYCTYGALRASEEGG